MILLIGLNCNDPASLEKSDKETKGGKTTENSNPTIWLNDKKIGTFNDAAKLKEEIEKLHKVSEKNGVVYHEIFIVNSNVQLKNFVKFENLNLKIPKKSLQQLEDNKSDPNKIIITIQDTDSPPEIPNYAALNDEKQYFHLAFKNYTLPQDDSFNDLEIRQLRAFAEGLEIDESGNFLINYKYEFPNSENKDIQFETRQRPIKKEDIKSEIKKMLDNDVIITWFEIIANENIRFDKLKEVFEAAEEFDLAYNVQIISAIKDEKVK